jgi:hypothetical protein
LDTIVRDFDKEEADVEFNFFQKHILIKKRHQLHPASATTQAIWLHTAKKEEEL